MAKDADTNKEEMALLDAVIERLRALRGHFPLSDETAEVIWRTTSPVSTSSRFDARIDELIDNAAQGRTRSIAAAIRGWRQAAQLSIAQLARQMRVAEDAVAGLEAGEHPATRPPEFWVKLARTLSIDGRTVAEVLRAAYGAPLMRHGMTAARSDDLDPEERRRWLDVADPELEERVRDRLDETIRRLERERTT